MATLREWVTRLWGTLRPSRRDADLEAELRLHLELATEDERRRANSSEDAQRVAAIRSGSMAQAIEAVRDLGGPQKHVTPAAAPRSVEHAALGAPVRRTQAHPPPP